MKKAFAGVVLVVAFVAVAAAGAAVGRSHRVVRPFVAVGLALGMSGAGDGASTPTGEQLRCWSGRRFAENLTLRNRSDVPVTLTGAVLDPSSAAIIQRVAVQVRLAPPQNGGVEVPGIRNWNRSAATPVSIPPGRSAWVQSNFRMQNCMLLAHRTLIANRAITLTFTATGSHSSQQLAVPSARIILTR